MSLEWIAIEVSAVLAENFAFIYFLHSRYEPKYSAFWPQFTAWCALVLWGLAATFFSLPVYLYDLMACLIMFLYLFVFKYGSLLQKLLGVLITGTVAIATSIAGAAVASAIMRATIEHTAEYQDISRLLAIMFIKMLQISVFYALAKKHNRVRNLKKGPAIVLSIAAIIDYIYIYVILSYLTSSDLNAASNHLPEKAIGALFVIIMIFLLYELFIREETKNLELAMRLQRFELEPKFHKKISVDRLI